MFSLTSNPNVGHRQSPFRHQYALQTKRQHANPPTFITGFLQSPAKRASFAIQNQILRGVQTGGFWNNLLVVQLFPLHCTNKRTWKGFSLYYAFFRRRQHKGKLLLMPSFGDETVTVKSKHWMPPLGSEPVTFCSWVMSYQGRLLM